MTMEFRAPTIAVPTAGEAAQSPALEAERLSFWYGKNRALNGVTVAIERQKITAFIGPSGCGKSTLIRCFNRMNDLVSGIRVEGDVRLNGSSVLDPSIDVNELRRRVGMVFQRSNPFPKTIYDNVAYGLRIQGMRRKRDLDPIVERSLRGAALWDEVEDRLHKSALELSGGQQQRLCIARAIAVEPEVLLMDEPCSALDPTATAKIEELMLQLREQYTIVVVTHNMQQAARVSNYTAFLHLGELVEIGPTEDIFVRPSNPRTEAYITGRFG
jgi:phosphate transport system ATP-binding protein